MGLLTKNDIYTCTCGALFSTNHVRTTKCSLCRTRARMMRATTSYKCLHDPSGLNAYKHSYISLLQMREMLKFAYLETGSVWKQDGVTYRVRGEQNQTDTPPVLHQWLDSEDAELYLDAVSKNGRKPEEDSGVPS